MVKKQTHEKNGVSYSVRQYQEKTRGNDMRPIQTHKFGNFYIEGTKLWKRIEKKKEITLLEIGRASYIDKVERCIEDRTFNLVIKFFSIDGEWDEITIPREKLTKTELNKLLSRGIDIGGNRTDDVIEFLNLCQDNVEIVDTFMHLGWFTDTRTKHLVFRHQQIYVQDSKPYGSYIGNHQLEPQGSFDTYKNGITNHVIGNRHLETIMAVGFSSALVGYLNESGICEMDSLLINMISNSTTGKTTALSLCASIWGNPRIGSGVVQSFNATTNALQASLNGNYGILQAYDETSMNNLSVKGLTSLIYAMAQNREKMRLNKDSKHREVSTWATTCCFTGESSFLGGNAQANEGLYVRLFEFTNIIWTKDAENAEAIKELVLENYGHAGIKFVEYLMALSSDAVKQRWIGTKATLKSRLPNSRFLSRISDKFALIILAAEFANEAMGLGLSIESITSVLVEQEEATRAERELAPKFYDQLREFIVANIKNFKVGDEPAKAGQVVYGKIDIIHGKADSDPSKTYCYLLRDVVKDFANENGFADVKILMKELKGMGVLKCDAETNTTKKSIFSEDEQALRDASIKNAHKYSDKGERTHCIIFDGDIVNNFFPSKPYEEPDQDEEVITF